MVRQVRVLPWKSDWMKFLLDNGIDYAAFGHGFDCPCVRFIPDQVGVCTSFQLELLRRMPL